MFQNQSLVNNNLMSLVKKNFFKVCIINDDFSFHLFILILISERTPQLSSGGSLSSPVSSPEGEREGEGEVGEGEGDGRWEEGGKEEGGRG